ncbi:hypothetical protein PENCOP_c014G00177 [Penicillium coprophilum]|uniref:Uncharacterized protein n=1 Tax=Penicillium coprophilum TaxID=36646 RepID=A0A1V6U9I1_9EURO|nr:hypothetical protein PENCOP_c014G00177 [Penicillium coprophilum]
MDETRSNTIKRYFEALRPGGLPVNASGALGKEAGEASPWWLPSQQTKKNLVEGARFNWVKGEIQLSQTKLTENQKGGIESRDAVVKHALGVFEVVGRQRHNGSSTVNYIRLRLVAQQPELDLLGSGKSQPSDITCDVSGPKITGFTYFI